MVNCAKIPELIAISETKLRNGSIQQVGLENYDFLHADSETNAGGVGLFILNGVCYLPRKDLNINLPGCRNLWVELTSRNDLEGITIGVIYRQFLQY